MNENVSKSVNPTLDRIFNLEELPKVTLEIQLEAWNGLLLAFDDAPRDNYWVEGNFIFDNSSLIPTQTIPRVALRVRGNSSRSRPEGNEGELHNPVNPVWRQASFAIQFARFVENQTFETLSRLDLKFTREDPTRIREVYAFNLYQKAGITSGPLMSMCRLYIRIIGGAANPAYFGIYKLKEFIDEDFLANRAAFFGDDSPGPLTSFLWKGDNGAALNNYDPSAIADRDVYDLRTNSGGGGRAIANAQLGEFVRNLVTLEGNALREWANQIMDVRLLMRTYMANVICGNMDDYWSHANNFNFYFNTHGRFFFIHNDFDTTLGTGFSIDAATQYLFYWGNEGHPLIQKLLGIEEFREMYTAAFYELTNEATGPFYVERSIERIKKWQALIHPYLFDETIHNGCDNATAGCIVGHQGNDAQTPFEDSTAWWTSGGNNRTYRVLERGPNNFFEMSGRKSRPLEKPEPRR